jgi:hypothetical protein
MKKVLALLTLILVQVAVASAQTGASTNKLSFMIGEWKGNGWMMTQSGKQFTSIIEKVDCKLDCEIFTVAGIGTQTDSSTMKNSVVHDAFGIISYDKTKGKFTLRAYKKDNVTETELEIIGEKVIRWNLTIPNNGGTMRFTTDFSEPNKWKGTGEYSRDGTDWIKMMETRLEKVK